MAAALSFPVITPSTPSALPDAVWRADQMGSYRSTPVPSGYPALDRELPNGGWPPSVLIELLLAQAGIGELRLLAPVLAGMTQAEKNVILLAPPHIPYAAALAELGINLKKLILIEVEQANDRIWAIEQTLKSASFGALLCWLPQARSDHLRRLQLAAAGGDGLTFVFRPRSAQDISSPAPLRISCQPAASGGIALELIKRRGPLHATPLILPLSIPEILQQPLAKRSPSNSSNSHDRNNRNTRNTTPDPTLYAVDRPSLAATAARRRLTQPA